jgi:glutamine amidotransferase
MVAAGNRYGCQFHPERSGRVGARILQNFLALPC